MINIMYDALMLAGSTHDALHWFEQSPNPCSIAMLLLCLTVVWSFRAEGPNPASGAAGQWLRKAKQTTIAAEASAKLKTTLDAITKIKEVHQHGTIALLHLLAMSVRGVSCNSPMQCEGAAAAISILLTLPERTLYDTL